MPPYSPSGTPLLSSWRVMHGLWRRTCRNGAVIVCAVWLCLARIVLIHRRVMFATRAWMSADEGAAAAVRIRQLTTRYAALVAGVGTSTAAGTPGCFYFTHAP